MTDRTIIRFCLATAIAVPLLYFGTQLVAAPFYPHYSFHMQIASMLGTRRSHHPAIFNLGMILDGIAAIAASYGFYRAFRICGTHAILAALISLSTFFMGVLSIKAGLFPLPDPRHGSWVALNYFLLLIPFLVFAALWKERVGRMIRVGLAACIPLALLFFVLIDPALNFTGLHVGTLQRLVAFGAYFPVGAAGYLLSGSWAIGIKEL